MSSYIDYHKFRRGESCTEDGCKARKYYIEDGKKFCQRGHEQANFTQTQQDEDDWNAQGKKSRKKREGKEKVVKVLSGRNATDHYLQCYQLILWKQVHWLINIKGFPTEFEVVVRDLWSLRISDFHRVGKSGYSSQMFSSQGEGDGTDTDGTGFRSTSSRRSMVEKDKLPRLIETLILCYLGTLLMRLPISLGDFHRWVMKEEMVYIRAIKEIPKDMRTQLPPYHYSALEIRTELKASSFHRTVLQMIQFYNIDFEMVFPPLNAPLLIFRYIKDLGLPLEIYHAVRRLATLLEFDFAFHIPQKKVHEIRTYPEIQIISMIILATKLNHPFDTITRVPESDTDPTILRMDWKKWQQAMSQEPSKGLRPGKAIKVTDADVFGMSEQELDDYMDWYQRTWIDDRDPKMAPQILELFPLQDLPPKPAVTSGNEHEPSFLQEIQKALIYQKPKAVSKDEGKDIKRPGHLYRRYRSVDDLSGDAKAFYERAAEITGTSLDMLVRGVLQLETMLNNWYMAKRKIRLLEDYERRSESNIEADDED